MIQPNVAWFEEVVKALSHVARRVESVVMNKFQMKMLDFLYEGNTSIINEC